MIDPNHKVSNIYGSVARYWFRQCTSQIPTCHMADGLHSYSD